MNDDATCQIRKQRHSTAEMQPAAPRPTLLPTHRLDRTRRTRWLSSTIATPSWCAGDVAIPAPRIPEDGACAEAVDRRTVLVPMQAAGLDMARAAGAWEEDVERCADNALPARSISPAASGAAAAPAAAAGPAAAAKPAAAAAAAAAIGASSARQSTSRSAKERAEAKAKAKARAAEMVAAAEARRAVARAEAEARRAERRAAWESAKKAAARKEIRVGVGAVLAQLPPKPIEVGELTDEELARARAKERWPSLLEHPSVIDELEWLTLTCPEHKMHARRRGHGLREQAPAVSEGEYWVMLNGGLGKRPKSSSRRRRTKNSSGVDLTKQVSGVELLSEAKQVVDRMVSEGLGGRSLLSRVDSDWMPRDAPVQ